MGAFDGYLRQIEEFNRLTKPLFDIQTRVALVAEAALKPILDAEAFIRATGDWARIQESFRSTFEADEGLRRTISDAFGGPAETGRRMEELYASLNIRSLDFPLLPEPSIPNISSLDFPPLPEPPFPKKFADRMPKPREPKPFIGFVNTNSVACAHCGQSVPYTAHRCSYCGAPRIQ